MELRGKVALVTGAGHRVGREIALTLGECGMRVAVHYHATAGGAAETVRRISAGGGGGTAVSFPGDLTAAGAPEKLVADVVASLGALHVLVNSAAVMKRTPMGTVRADEWDAIFALNLRAPFFLAQAAAPHLERGADGTAVGSGGAIVNIADLAAFESWPAYVPHSLSKAGVVHMTRALARVLAPHVRVNAVAPGAVLLPESWTEADAEKLRETTPLKRLGSPRDVAHAVRFLLEADYVTGETIIVDGGRHVRH